MGNHQFNHDSRSGFISRIRFHLGMLGCREIQFVMDGLVDAYFSHLNHQPQLNNNNDLKVDEGKKVSELPACDDCMVPFSTRHVAGVFHPFQRPRHVTDTRSKAGPRAPPSGFPINNGVQDSELATTK